MNKEDLEKLLDKCINELSEIQKGEYSPEKAERNAALFLEMQIRLADYLSVAEMKAKMAKSEMERVASNKYFEYKQGSIGGDKKMTEVALEHMVAKNEEVFKMKQEMVEYEAEYKKWNYVIGILSNGHILCRNLGKREFGN